MKVRMAGKNKFCKNPKNVNSFKIQNSTEYQIWEREMRVIRIYLYFEGSVVNGRHNWLRNVKKHFLVLTFMAKVVLLHSDLKNPEVQTLVLF